MISNEFGGSKADTAVKLALIFFISLFSFSVGTFVGKQVSDTERRRAALEEDYGKSRAVASEHDEHSHDKDTLTNEDVDRLTKEFLAAEDGDSHNEVDPQADDEHANEKAEESHSDSDGYKKVKSADAHKEKAHESKKEKHKEEHKSANKSDSHKKDSVEKAAERVADGKAPMPAKKEVRKPSSTLPKMPPSAVGKYTVQVAAYPSEKEAKGHAAELKESGYSAFYIPAVVKGNTWYRVSIGLFDSYKTANNFRRELGKQTKMNSALVKKIVK